MLFNPTPIERLTTLTTQLIDKHAGAADELKVLQTEIATLHASLKTKDDEISTLNDELLEKDIEIEAIVSKIESLLG
jgi:predicted  nucleic acid-binding Zn-ribbon protein